MKHVYVTALVAYLLGASALTAKAADVYQRGGGLKDEVSPSREVGVSNTRGGFYIKGDLGIANGDRDVSRDISGEAGRTKLDKKGPDREGRNCETGDTEAECLDNTLEDVLYFDPKYVGALDSIKSSDTFDGMVFGGEISYLWKRPTSRIGLEVAAGVTFYNDSKTTHNFDDVIAGKFRELEDGVLGAPEDFDVAIAGYTSVERDLDIDLILRGHYFLADNLSVYAGGGFSLAKATISGSAAATAPDGSPVEHSFKDSVWAPGYVLNAGAQFWLDDNWTLGVDYTFKVHSFDTSKSSTFGDLEDCTPYLTANDKTTVDDEVHAIKARIGRKLGGSMPSLD